VNDALGLTALAFVIVKVVDLVKQGVPWGLPGWQKSTLSVVLGACGGIWLLGGRDGLLGGLAAAGGASFLHEIMGLLSMRSDDLVQTIMSRADPAARMRARR